MLFQLKPGIAVVPLTYVQCIMRLLVCNHYSLSLFVEQYDFVCIVATLPSSMCWSVQDFVFDESRPIFANCD